MFLSNVTNQISTTVTVDPLKDNYIVNLQPSTTATYNLPQIKTNGTNFLFNRIDNLNALVSINAFIGDTITLNSGTTVTTYNLTPFTSLYLFSLDGTWNIICKSNAILHGEAIFCASLVGNNGNKFISFGSNASYQIICVFPYTGTQTGLVISKVIIVTTRDTTGTSLNWANGIRLYDIINSQLLVERNALSTPILTMFTTPNTSYWVINVLQSELLNFSSTSTLISLDIIINTNNTGIYSISVF